MLQSTQFDVEKDIANCLITSHEHISQRKFNQAAVVILKEYDKQNALQVICKNYKKGDSGICQCVEELQVEDAAKEQCGCNPTEQGSTGQK